MGTEGAWKVKLSCGGEGGGVCESVRVWDTVG